MHYDGRMIELSDTHDNVYFSASPSLTEYSPGCLDLLITQSSSCLVLWTWMSFTVVGSCSLRQRASFRVGLVLLLVAWLGAKSKLAAHWQRRLILVLGNWKRRWSWKLITFGKVHVYWWLGLWREMRSFVKLWAIRMQQVKRESGVREILFSWLLVAHDWIMLGCWDHYHLGLQYSIVNARYLKNLTCWLNLKSYL